MKKIITLIMLFAIFTAGHSLGQDKNYTKISTPDFWKSLTLVKEQIKKEGSKQYQFGDWQIFFPRTYINFVKKFPKDNGTFEYYVKVDGGGAYDPQIRFKEGPGKSSEAYIDPDGKEEKLLLKEVDEIISKIIAAFGSSASLK